MKARSCSMAGAGPTIAQAMDEDDLRGYRALLAKSEDDEHALLARNDKHDARGSPRDKGDHE